MTLDVIGAGFGRTGTLSLKAALEHLGYNPCYHMVELMDNPGHLKHWSSSARGGPQRWDQLLDGYRATVDWPACYFWQDLLKAYPNAKVILTVRDPVRWYESARATVGSRKDKLRILAMMLVRPDRIMHIRVLQNMIRKDFFQGRLDDRQHTIDIFNRHIADVQRTVPSDRLLVYEVKQGWGPLCAFLGVDVPDIPFPHLNDSEDFHSVIGRHVRRRLMKDLTVSAPLSVGAVLAGVALISRRRRKGHRYLGSARGSV